jgi:hypothetical protein
MLLSLLTPTGRGNYFPNNHSSRATHWGAVGNETNLLNAVSMAYDGESRQIEFDLAWNQTKELYGYDGEGRRVQHQQYTSRNAFGPTGYHLVLWGWLPSHLGTR